MIGCSNMLPGVVRTLYGWGQGPVHGCARFAEFLQNFSGCQILWSLCSVVFHELKLTLKLPIQTSLSVAPKLPVCTRSGEELTYIFVVC